MVPLEKERKERFGRIFPSPSRAAPMTSSRPSSFSRIATRAQPDVFICHQSSRLTYAHPWSPSPDSSIARAAAIAFSWVSR